MNHPCSNIKGGDFLYTAKGFCIDASTTFTVCDGYVQYPLTPCETDVNMQAANHTNILPVSISLPGLFYRQELLFYPNEPDLWYPLFVPINGSSFYTSVNYEGLCSIENNLDSLQEQVEIIFSKENRPLAS